MPFDESQYQTVQFCIPSLDTKIQLAKPWAFDLYNESRNQKLIETLGLCPTWRSYWKSRDPNIDLQRRDFSIKHPSGSVIQKITLPAGTILGISRIYIRRPFTDFDSVTFSIKKGNCPEKHIHGRFWSKLRDVNRIVCFPIGETKDVFEAHVESGKQLKKDRFDFL